MRKHFELEGVITLGASGGVLPALSLVMDMPAEKFEQFFVNEITGIMVTGLARYWFGGATRWLGVTREMLATLPVDTYERASGKVYVSATRLNRFGVQEEHITGWKSNDEMIEAILCSTYIPFFSDGFLYKTYKGRKYVDGAILNLQPIYDEDTCCIHPRLWRTFPWWDSLHFKRPLEEYQKQFKLGYEDAQAHPEFWERFQFVRRKME